MFIMIASSISADVYLGLYLSEIDSEKDNSQQKAVTGLYIHNVVKDSPADKSGLQSGDILISINKDKLLSVDQFDKLLRNYKPGEEVYLGYLRHKQELETKLILADKHKHGKSLFESKIEELLEESKTFIFKFESQEDKVIGVEIQGNDSNDSLGVLITKIIKNSPAEKANLQTGDIILKIDKTTISESSDLVNYLQKKEVGEKVTLTILRDQEKLTSQVEVVLRKSIFE